jgi:hypothetical protein
VGGVELCMNAAERRQAQKQGTERVIERDAEGEQREQEGYLCTYRH